MEIPDGWQKNKIRDIAKIDVGRDLIEDRFSKDKNEQYCFPVYSNTVEKFGHYGFYDIPEYTAKSVTVVARGIGLGRAFARTEPFGAIGRLLVLSPLESVFNVNFLADYLNSNFRLFYESGGIPQLPGKTLGSYAVILPPLPEQRRIAEILGTWDRAIAATEALITASEAQKKALMQQLLTGKRRLPGFEGEWEEVRLDEFFQFKKGQGISKKSVVENGLFPCVLYGELYTHYGDVVRTVKSATNSNQGIPSVVGDVLIPASTTTTGIDLANATAVLEDGIRLGGDINILRPLDANTDSRFMARLLTYVETFKLARRAQGSTIVHLYGSHLKDIIVSVPDIAEQVAISDTIDLSEKPIQALQAKLQTLKTEKAALMQQLLTGKRRVKLTEAAA